MLSRSRMGFGLVAIALLALLGCSGGSSDNGGTPPDPWYPVPVRQFGVAESELYDAAHHPSGIVVGPGSGQVTLLLEPTAGPVSPLSGDTASVGTDEMWFDVDNTGTVSLVLNEQNLALVARLEISDATGKLLAWADAAQRQSSLSLKHGRYLLRLVPAAVSKLMTPVYVWFGGTPASSPTDLQRLATGNCAGCNLAGADLSQYNLAGANLVRADLRLALLVPGPGANSPSLTGTNLMTIYIGGYGSSGTATGGADLSGANLSSARLDGALMTSTGSNAGAKLSAANLSAASMTATYLYQANFNASSLVAADLSGSVLTQATLRAANLAGAVLRDADLSGADLSAAGLAATDFTNARLDGATWSDGRICAAGSTGVCR